MKLNKLFDFFIEQGIEKDPRGKKAVVALLKEEKEKFDKLSEGEKKDYDSDRLNNPYLDSRIIYGSGNEEIKTVIAGIDMETPEILLASALRSSGKKIDLVLTHHPEGKAYATFYNVINMQADIFSKYGVPINIAESLTDSRVKEVSRKVMPQNHNRAYDAAKLLGFPFMSAHTVADNQVASYLQGLFYGRKPKYLKDVLNILKEIPEYTEAERFGSGPVIFSGSKESRAGKVFVDMTGGTEGPKDILEYLADTGIGTIVGMHMSEDHYKDAEKYHIRVVIAGHISSDNLGLNLLFDAAEKKFGPINFIECSGFRRFRRRK
jgi:hypothetical protein